MSIDPERNERAGVQVVRRAAAILQALRGEHDGLSLSEIANRVGLARSTVHRLVRALEQERFVVAASPNGGYRLGPVLASLALSAGRDLALVIHPYLVELSRELNETVDLAVLEHDHVLFIDQAAPAPQRLHAVSAVGAVFPVHCTANGKALLARMPDQDVIRLLPRKLASLTPHTITTTSKLLEELAVVRQTGVAYDREEHTLGICAIGAALSATDGPLAAITVPLPAQRFHGNETELETGLLRARAAIDRALAAPR
jgi:DNA-binding IclR family transcriptional regulator